jgi:hypothetical protein
MIKKKIISTILVLCIAMSVVPLSMFTTFAATDAESITIPEYTSRGDFVTDFNNGKTVAKFKGSEKTFKFTLDKSSNVMFSIGAMKNGYNSGSAKLYNDIYCTNQISMSTNENNSHSYYTYLTKGTYFLNVSSYDTDVDFIVAAGQIKGSELNAKLSYVKTNSDKTATLKFSNVKEPDKLYYLTCNYGQTTYTPNEANFDSKNQFTLSYATSQSSHTNIKVLDKYGYEYYGYANVLNKYTATLVGDTDTAYTGKAVKLKNITLKAGYDGVSYTANYKNNKKIGKATVTFKGKGQCVGNYTTTFKIIPGKIKSFNGNGKNNSSNRNVKFTWKASKGATSYVVQTKSSYSAKYKTVKTTKAKSYTLKVNKGTTYVKVYGIKKVKGKTYKSVASELYTNCYSSSYSHKYTIYVHSN